MSDRTVRTYLRELEKYVEVQQGGDGVEASYYFTAALLSDLPSELTSGLLPGCFRSENPAAPQEPAQHQQFADENFRAEKPKLGSSGSSCSCNDQSERTVQEHREPAVAVTGPSPYEKAQTEAIANAVGACGFKPAPNLIAKLEDKRRFYGVTGFVVASAINRAMKRVERKPSSRPQGLGWVLVVVENELAQQGQKRTPAPPAPATQNLPWLHPVAEVHQVDSAAVATTRVTEPERREETQPKQSPLLGSPPITGTPEHLHQPTPAAIAATVRVPALSIEDRRLLAEARKIYPFASRENLLEAVAEMRAARPRAVEELAVVNPRPPQREVGPLREVGAPTRGIRR